VAAACAAPPVSPVPKVTTFVQADARTGRLVRKVAVDREAPGSLTASFREAVEQAARQNALPVHLVHSVVKVESGYNPFAVSPKGALGLMQLTPSTARRFGVSDAFNPVQNLHGGARYLRYLLDRYGENNTGLALAAYNAGEGAVERYGGVPPYPETRNYLVSVGRAFEQARKRAAGAEKPRPAEGRPQTVEAGSVEVQNRIREIVEPDGRVRYTSE
jgi:soluble lytic murein transglycosylase-like protein